MDSSKFEEALDRILLRDPRFDRAAYHFMREALDFTLKQRKKSTGQEGHVTGQQLLEGVRQYALKQFGPMVPTVFDYWSIRRTVDFGAMVFNLIEEQIFGKAENDRLEDFKDVYTFHDAFVAPFLPKPPVLPARQISVDAPAPELN